MSDQLQSSILGAIATVLAALVGVWAISWQVGRQARHAIKQNRSNEVMKLRLEIYREIEDLCVQTSNSEVELSSYMASIANGLSTYLNLVDLGANPSPPRYRTQQLMNLRADAAAAVIGLIQVIERWRIIDPRLGVFQTAFNVAQHEIDQAWHSAFQCVLPVLPFDPPHPSVPLQWSPPTRDVVEELGSQSKRLGDACGTLGAWILDFRRELQLAMLGELFENELPLREPLDARYFVITLARAAELERHLVEDTDWGREMALAKVRAAAAVQSAG